MSLRSQFERAAAVHNLALALPDTEEVLKEMEGLCLVQAFAKIRDGALTEREALAILQEVYSYRELLRKLKARVQAATGGTT